MRNILGFYLMPHPPIIIPSIGKGEEKQIKKTSQACEKVAKDIKANKPDTIIIITPHGLMFQDAISISYDLTISGNLANFNAPEVSITKEIDTDLVNKIEGLAHQEKIATIKLNERITRTYNRTFEIDHGSLIPLYFIEKEYQNYKIIQITYSLLKEVDLYRFGNLIKEAIISLNKKTVIIA
ncbi:MAG: class III extradiol dioxygenase subunit B-like domain-containing protein, partial [Bacilli bacterium]|nr:class III extradiol dioxygenase subunit B-like domain-containing protein [Bacilli bacterium]